MAVIAREERLLNLLSALLTARTPLAFEEIRERVAGFDDDATEEALEKRFDRDKADLRALGVPLEYVQEDAWGRAGYRIARERFFLDEIRFTIEEGIFLAAIERDSADGARDGALSAGLRSALVKLSVDSPLPGGLRESVGEQQALDARVPREQGDAAARLAAMGEALLAHRPVRFGYYSLNRDEEGVRTVEVYGVGYYRGHWYVTGRDVEKDDDRVFRLSRVRGEVTVLPGPAYEIPEDFDLKRAIGRSPWELGEGEPIGARIRFEADVAWMIAENVRPGQEFVLEPGGGGVLALDAVDADALVRWVAQYGPAAEVLAPPALRERMRDHFRGVLARYGA